MEDFHSAFCIMKKIIAFVKKETVLTVAWILAIISAFFIHPSKAYISYIDFRSLGILWSLMVIMAGLKEDGFFEYVGSRLLGKTKKVWQLVAVLVLLCFVFSMFITNDVALITFVPFAIYMLAACHRESLLIPVIVLQTLAANLGSMLMPIGNPQNLYLYGISSMSLVDFIKHMLPYSLISLVLLCISMGLIKGKNDPVTNELAKDKKKKLEHPAKLLVYGALFWLALFVVGRLLPYWVLLLAVLVLVMIMDRRVLLSIDYALLFTFVGFFLFTGNLGQLPVINQFLTSLVDGREVIVGVIASQFISNVPAALLLSSFTNDYGSLLVGVNLGGLGTLIASMASLISFKSLAHSYNEKKGKYLLVFTAMNLIYLVILFVAWKIIGV